MRKDWISIASKCPVLNGVEEDLLGVLMDQISFQIIRYGKNDLIAAQGEPVDKLMILLSGSARGEMTDYSGRMIKIEDIHSPKPVAGAFLFGAQNIFPVSLIANEDLTILKIEKLSFMDLMQKCPVILENYLNLVSSKAQFLTHKIQFLSLKSVRGKIAHYLLGLEKDQYGMIRIPESQQSIAELFGVARPSVARGFKQFEDEGILEMRNRMVYIIDADALASFLHE